MNKLIPLAAVVVFGAGCVHNTTTEDPDGWSRARNDSTGQIVVAFPTDLVCPTEDSCDVQYVNDDQHEGFVIRPVVP